MELTQIAHSAQSLGLPGLLVALVLIMVVASWLGASQGKQSSTQQDNPPVSQSIQFLESAFVHLRTSPTSSYPLHLTPPIKPSSHSLLVSLLFEKHLPCLLPFLLPVHLPVYPSLYRHFHPSDRPPRKPRCTLRRR
ncbi:unnamed protein product [Closterium sp. NIES-54]